MLRRIIALIMVLLLLPVLGCAEQDGENLLVNGGFENWDSSGMPTGWRTDAYIMRQGYTTYAASDDALSGAHSGMVHNVGENDARFAQTVKVEPSSLYLFSGWVKVVDMQDSGLGANLSVEGLYEFSESLYVADGEWHYLEMYGETGEDQHEVTVFARVGGYSGESIGCALFDDLSLRKVHAVPGMGIAGKWFHDRAPVAVAPVEEDEEEFTEAQPFWPRLLLISVVYGAAALLMMIRVGAGRNLGAIGRKGMPWWTYAALAAALILRVTVALQVEGYQVDVGCFLSWGDTMLRSGPTRFYQTTSFCDYVPAYLYVLGANEWLAGLFGGSLPTAFFHKLLPMLCDVAGAYLIGWFGCRRGMKGSHAGMLAALIAFSPAMILNSAAWCQMDSVLCLGLLVVAILAVQKKWAALLPVYVLCILIKPQALMLGPLGLVVLVMAWLRDRAARRQLLIGLGLSAAVAAVIIIPFAVHQEPGWLVGKYLATLASYPYATVNTANLYYLFGANWVSIEAVAGVIPCVTAAAISLAWSAALVILHRDGFSRLKAALKELARGRAGAILHRDMLPWLTAALTALFALAFAVMAVAGVTWSVLGGTMMALCFAVVIPMLIQSGKVEHVPLLGGVLFLLLYVLGIKMHERYLFPAVFLLGVAYALRRDWRVLLLLMVSGTTLFINEGIILDNSLRLGSSMGHLNQDTYPLNVILSLANVACVPLAVWCAFRTCCTPEPDEIREGITIPHHTVRPLNVAAYTTDPSLHWKRIDWLMMLGVTLIYAAVCLCNLGSTTAPQRPWRSTTVSESVIIDLGESYDDFSMLYNCQVSYSNFTVEVSDDLVNWSEEQWAEMNEGQCYRWKYVTPSYATASGARQFTTPMSVEDVVRFDGRYVRITAHQIGLVMNEVVFRDSEGNRIGAEVIGHEGGSSAVTDIGDPYALLDEQDTLSGEPSWYNGTYFDEIYHARTAHEHLTGEVPYETSHPPLGKLIMSVFVAIFGMTPFGWRFAGALMGILMLPAMYVLGKQLTKRTDMAFAAMMLMALDCMHFTQTRIATIDSFPVLFIIVSYLFMLRFMQRDMVMTPLKKLLPDLALSGLFMGCGIASKWIGVYAGAGLAVLFFWHCLRHQRMAAEARRMLSAMGKDADRQLRSTLQKRADTAFRRMVDLCLWCLLFFVAVPLIIYVLSYIPYFAYLKTGDPIYFLRMVIHAQEGMFSYHATPGLGMDHSFYSPWYEWPFIGKPMYYADAHFMPKGVSYAIFCFGNPAVWLVGLAGFAAVVAVYAKRHVYTLEGGRSALHLRGTGWSVAPAFVLIGLAAQYLPWVLVPRGTYIYHYFASLPFLMLSTMLLLYWVTLRWPKTGRGIMIVYLAACLACFIVFYPYASGVPVGEDWLDFAKQFLRIYYSRSV